MPRVHNPKKSSRGKEVKCGRCGAIVQSGERYYAWSFRYGGAHYRCSLHPPRQSELTQSKISGVLSALEAVQDVVADLDNAGDFAEAKDAVRSVVEDMQTACEEAKSEYEEAAEHFGGQGENQERAEQMEQAYDELEDIVQSIEQVEIEDPDDPDDDPEEDQDARREQAFQELTDAAERCNEVQLP
jgi:hypothetical protein